MERLTFVSTAVALAVALCTQGSFAQSKDDNEDRKYWISFVDKDNGLGKGPLATEPDLVSDRAQERRDIRSDVGAIDRAKLDAPVSQYYQTQLRSLSVDPIVQSRWLNAVSAFLSPDQFELVSKLDFVRDVSFVARSVDMSAPPEPLVVASIVEANGNANSLEYGASTTQLRAINAITPIEEGYIGEDLLLGFLDTTTDTLHPAFKHLVDDGRIVGLRDFTVEGGLPPQTNKHGLWTSSSALAFDNGQMIGACHGAKYMFATTEYNPRELNQEEDFLVAGMEWLEQAGADIVNISLGYSEFDNGQESYTYENMNGKTAKSTIASDIAVGLGVVVVSSAGNEGNRSWHYITAPGDGFSVITVGAVNSAGLLAGFSSRGPTSDGRTKPDISAMGVSVVHASVGGGYQSHSGTSFAAPLVSSVACQVLQANPSLNPHDVRTILRSTASQPANPDNNLGWGIVDATAAVNLAKVAVTSSEPDPVLPGAEVAMSVYPNPANGRAAVALRTQRDDSNASVELYDVLGRQVGIATRGTANPGLAIYHLDLEGLSPGMYFVRSNQRDVRAVQSLIVR